mmetsp:Transcript_87707/g.246398  ORF Transcript_87707/g.246398 Transcript_87707/m.246398 type:complete len:268 (+) Transcript_87707:84-887(+)
MMSGRVLAAPERKRVPQKRLRLGALLLLAAAGAALLAAGQARAPLSETSVAWVGTNPHSAANGGEPSAPASRRGLLNAALGGLVGAAFEEKAHADGGTKIFALPKIDYNDKTRCKWKSSSMGQANAARDKLFDLRECNMEGTDASNKDIAGVVMSDGNFKNVNFELTTLSKAIIQNATLDGANFRNAVSDRVSYKGSSMRGVIFQNTVLTGSSFEGCDLTNADFTDAVVEVWGIKPLCANPTLDGTNPVTGADTRTSAGCDNMSQLR